MALIKGRFPNDPLANTKMKADELSAFEINNPEIAKWAIDNSNHPTFEFIANYINFKHDVLNTVEDDSSEVFFKRSIEHKRLAYCLFAHMMSAFKVLSKNLDRPKTVGVPLGEAKASMKCSESKKDRIIKDGKELGLIEECSADWNLNLKLVFLSGKAFVHAFQKQVNDIPIAEHYELVELRNKMAEDKLGHVKLMDQFELLR